MARDSAKGSSLCRRLALWRRRRITASPEPHRIEIEDTAVVIDAILLRERAGLTTTLRQLHKASQVTQPRALKILGELERAGMVVIDRNNADAFESTITLSDQFKQRTAQNSIRDAA